MSELHCSQVCVIVSVVCFILCSFGIEPMVKILITAVVLLFRDDRDGTKVAAVSVSSTSVASFRVT